MRTAPAILARGPWAPDHVEARWSDEHYAPPPERGEAADAAIAALRDRGSPSHDGLAARLVRHEEADGRLLLDLQPVRWALRLVEGDASCSVAAMCLTRDSEGRWLAGRRAAWLASWAGRWALGAGGAVDVGESPVDTLTRELREEWSVEPDRLRVEALVRLVGPVGDVGGPPGVCVVLVVHLDLGALGQPGEPDEHDKLMRQPYERLDGQALRLDRPLLAQLAP